MVEQLRPVKPFRQEKKAGNLSPLRGSQKWDDVHNEAYDNFARREEEQNLAASRSKAKMKSASTKKRS